MNMKAIIEDQIDATITQLLRARHGMTLARGKDEFEEIGRQLEAAGHHLQDIQFNWTSLARASVPKANGKALPPP